MTSARIYQLPKSAMQSGRAKSEGWVLEFPPSEARKPDPVRGWIGSADTQAQVRLKFDQRCTAPLPSTKRMMSARAEIARPLPATGSSLPFSHRATLLSARIIQTAPSLVMASCLAFGALSTSQSPTGAALRTSAPSLRIA